MISRSRTVRVVAAAAMTGMMAGALASIGGCKDNNPSTNNPGMSSDNGTNMAGMAKHDCKGQNACKGQGGCSASENGCKGKNSCKGKGGCNTNK